ncbi:hypothetical protein AB1N83_006820 [Pleurotus pulmonarius]
MKNAPKAYVLVFGRGRSDVSNTRTPYLGPQVHFLRVMSYYGVADPQYIKRAVGRRSAMREMAMERETFRAGPSLGHCQVSRQVQLGASMVPRKRTQHPHLLYFLHGSESQTARARARLTMWGVKLPRSTSSQTSDYGINQDMLLDTV